ncbi:hypothetical protein FA15DRAFT_676413 [Coprinopsis marcescibilis]|uniref:Uncharacterized protein n=1 Tax=Coprinopsis marcescibilis TaxID=230819 RepID=A0A5C3KA71_COPMA|nr:hypothetical protein FA15DRAFT_676413 [Coprinopsis marcescibilis]
MGIRSDRFIATKLPNAKLEDRLRKAFIPSLVVIPAIFVSLLVFQPFSGDARPDEPLAYVASLILGIAAHGVATLSTIYVAECDPARSAELFAAKELVQLPIPIAISAFLWFLVPGQVVPLLGSIIGIALSLIVFGILWIVVSYRDNDSVASAAHAEAS